MEEFGEGVVEAGFEFGVVAVYGVGVEAEVVGAVVGAVGVWVGDAVVDGVGVGVGF